MLEQRMLSWEQVHVMRQGGVSFGVHTMTHPVVSQLHPSAFQEEFVGSRALLEAGLGVSSPDFAYPFGTPADCSLLAETFIEGCGYRSAVTTSEGYNSSGSNPRRLLRLQVEEDKSLAQFAFDLCRLFLEGSTETGDAVCGRERPELLAATGAKTAAP